MASISANNGVLSFKPKSGGDSYFYETFACQAASTNGYDSIQFTIKGPAGGSASLEIQTQTACGASGYQSFYAPITGLTGNSQVITVPLKSFSGANANAVTGFVWSGFSSSDNAWEMSKIQFGCGGAPAPSNGPTGTISASKEATGTPTTMVTSTAAVPAATGTCAPLLIDDWTSQSRLTFLYYNAMMLPSSDDASMGSLVVGQPAKNRVTINRKDAGSYFYSQLGCTDAKKAGYNGISLRIKAPAGSSLSVELDSSASCDPGAATIVTVTSQDLGWSFDGTEKLYTIPFSKFPNIDPSKLVTILFSGFSTNMSFGPMAFYCGSSGEYIVTTSAAPAGPSSTVAAPPGSQPTLVVDRFASKDSNALGFWHGGDEGMTTNYNGGKLTIESKDADYSFYTQISGSCTDMTKYKDSYLHIAYSGSTAFSVALQQHNSKCDQAVAPYPETWDSLEASRYAKNGHIYIPMSHFKVELSRSIGFSLKGFYKADPVTLSVIEIVPSVARDTVIPNKLESGDLVFACKRPNSFAFAIDDGSPEYAQEVMKIVKEEGIKVTFFTVGAPLLDPSTNLTNVYREMLSQGHQVALHSQTHPKMEGLPDYESIDWEYNEDIKTVEKQLDGLHTNYFRPPFGTEGARMRQRLAQTLGAKPTITMWSVDVEDWLWAETDTPEQQLTAFQRDVDKGGNLVVLHYLYPSTVSYLRQFIQKAKATGKQLMRVDQCMEDPNAPAL